MMRKRLRCFISFHDMRSLRTKYLPEEDVILLDYHCLYCGTAVRHTFKVTEEQPEKKKGTLVVLDGKKKN